jgi:23S rRNA (pseudouridine1915-N3)-methyltransferase
LKIRLLSVGKPKDALLVRLHDRYAARLGRLGIAYGVEIVPEVRAGGRYSDDHVKAREAAALTARLEERETVVALDAAGEALSSERLAERLAVWATRRATFVVGGPLGLDAALLDRACARWSLSRLTLTHEWVRCLVAEQLYRAATLIRGLPYHK